MIARALLPVTRAEDGNVVGYRGLLFDGRGTADEPELAYELLRRAQGVGYATEAARAVVGWAGDVGYRRLVAGVRVWNVASRNVLRELGFVDTGQVEPDAGLGDSLITAETLLGPGGPTR